MTFKLKNVAASSLALLAVSGATIALLTSTPNTVAGQKGQANMTTKATKDSAKASAAAQAAIKGPEGKSDPNKKARRPASKGGTRTRAGEGIVHIDSRVGDPVAIYIDGSYQGSVAAYGDMYLRAAPDTYEIFGKCEHDYTWGPQTIYVSSGNTRKWTITE